jgi:type I restriction enzyme S subunit
VIPKEWRQAALQEIALFENGQAHESIVDENGKFQLINSKFVSTEGREVKRVKERLSPLDVGDIAIVMSDIPKGKALAKCYLVKEPNKFSLNQRIGKIRAKDANPLYLYYALNRNSYFLQFDSGVGQTNLKKSEILECPLLLPPMIEQEKIGEILSVWDKGISSLELLIKRIAARLEAIRSALFKNDQSFKRIRLGELIVLHYGKSPKHILVEGGSIPVVGTGGVTGFSNDSLCHSKGIVVGRKGTIDKPQLISTPFWAIDTTYFVTESSAYDLSWLYHLLIHLKLRQYNEASGVPSLNRETLYDLDVHLPPIERQTAVSRSLDAIQSEIDIYSKVASLLRTQKQGLVQALLSGRTRVKV